MFGRLVLPFLVATAGAAVLLAVQSTASADTVYIRNPMAASGTVTSNWNHPSQVQTPYAERALDMTQGYGNTQGKPVYFRAENVSDTDYVYYEINPYPSGNGCTGNQYTIYKHPPGSPPYTKLGYDNNLHITGYPSSGSYNIVIGDAHSAYIGTIAAAQCGSDGAHLHHGHNTSGGDTFNDAYWITTSTGIGSDDITLYK
jgi:hypothetical protein